MDFLITDHGSITTVTPLTEAAHSWLDEHVSAEPWQWLGATLAVDHRMADPLINGIMSDGLAVGPAYKASWPVCASCGERYEDKYVPSGHHHFRWCQDCIKDGGR
jgi:hypothetical protein